MYVYQVANTERHSVWRRLKHHNIYSTNSKNYVCEIKKYQIITEIILNYIIDSQAETTGDWSLISRCLWKWHIVINDFYEYPAAWSEGSMKRIFMNFLSSFIVWSAIGQFLEFKTSASHHLFTKWIVSVLFKGF